MRIDFVFDFRGSPGYVGESTIKKDVCRKRSTDVTGTTKNRKMPTMTENSKGRKRAMLVKPLHYNKEEEGAGLNCLVVGLSTLDSIFENSSWCPKMMNKQSKLDIMMKIELGLKSKEIVSRNRYSSKRNARRPL
eukprot:7073263-Ditylum_brightwellii.AAC.1